jgi:branched-chain amino acid transport system permease protein
MTVVLNQIFHGLMLGTLYALIGSGYTLIFGTLDVVSFSHGDVCIFGAFVLMTISLILVPWGIVFQSWYSILLIVLAVMLITGGIGILIERVTVKPFRKHGHMPLFLASLAISFVLREIIKHLYPQGANPKPFPITLSDLRFQWIGISLQLSNLIILIIAAITFISIFIFVNRTKIGLQIRATSQDMDGSHMMGVNLNKIYAAIFFVASAIGALAGILNGIYFQIIQYNMGVVGGIIGFSAAVLGGLGNVYGAIIGGLILGLAESLTSAFVPGGAPYKEVFAFVIVIVFLAFKPTGILGQRVYEKV